MNDCNENCKDIRNGVCPPMKMFCPKKLAEHDKQTRAEVIDLLDRHLWNYSHEVWEDFKPILEQLKGAENDQR